MFALALAITKSMGYNPKPSTLNPQLDPQLSMQKGGSSCKQMIRVVKTWSVLTYTRTRDRNEDSHVVLITDLVPRYRGVSRWCLGSDLIYCAYDS